LKIFYDRFLNIAISFLRQVRAATAIEYALIAAAVGIAIIAVIFALGSQITELIDDLIFLISGT
jgi:Flp pilus assembly pilin Flp